MEQELSQNRKEFLIKDFEQGFSNYCQLRVTGMTNGTFQSRVEIKDHHRQQDGFTHAGVMATMADQTAGYAGFTTVAEIFQILTIEFKINFLKPAFGKALECHSSVIRRGKQIIIAESEIIDIRDDEKVPVAKAMVTLMVVPKEKLDRKSV